MDAKTLPQLNLEACLKDLKPRKANAHKGDFGHVLVVGGDYGLGGAPRMTGEAALRTGAGLVSIATRPEHSFAISGNCPELMAKGVSGSPDLKPMLERATVVAIGPGLGQDNWGKALFQEVLKSELPLVVDADGLNLLASNPEHRDTWILTPHPGEAARLLKRTSSDIQHDRVKAIVDCQSHYGGVIVLKGAGTLVIGKDKNRILEICPCGNPGMATGGMGDILTGVIAGLVAQGLTLHRAARLGVSVHAKAGDLAAASGQRGMKATDLLIYIRQCLNPSS